MNEVENTYWDGFPFEEEIEAAALEAVKTFGPQGNMLPSGKRVIHNARVVATNLRNAVVWYGDVDFSKNWVTQNTFEIQTP